MTAVAGNGTTATTYCQRVRSVLGDVREAVRETCRFLAGQGLSEEEVQSWELVVVEAANNVAEHGGESPESEHFRMDTSVLPEVVEVRLTDHTAGFEYPVYVDLPDPMNEGGRGLFLLESLCDSVDYLRGRGINCMVLRRRRLRPGTAEGLVGKDERALRDEIAELNEALDGMTEELASSYESLTAIFKFSQELGKQRDLAEFARLLLDHLCKITDSDWYVLRIKGRDGRLAAFAVSDETVSLPDLDPDDAAMKGAGERRAAAERQDVWLEGPTEKGDPLAVFPGTRAGLVHPFYLNEDLVGTLALGATRRDEPLSAGQVNVLHTFSDFLALQILNARYQDEHVKAKVVSRELEIAANIQRSLLPRRLPEHDAFTLAGFYQSAQSVGGDFYDAVRLPGGGLLLTIADVMGKGVPAAMFAAILRTVLRAQMEFAPEPAALLRRANQIIFDDLDRVDMFITAQLVYVSPDGKRGICAGAGHCPLLVANLGKNEFLSFEADGPPLGIVRDVDYADNLFELGNGSRLVLYTDGVTEARGAGGELWGDDRMSAWWRRAVSVETDAAGLKGSLIREVSQFVGESAATDDLTFMILANKPST